MIRRAPPDAAVQAIMRIMDCAFDPQWGEAWNYNQIASALQLSNTHATLMTAEGTVPADPAQAVGFAVVRAAPGEEEILLIAVDPAAREAARRAHEARVPEQDGSRGDQRCGRHRAAR